MNKYIYLQDKAFLKIIDELPIKSQQVRLTVLTLQNKPIAQIEGVATGGSISVNGSSTVRRSGSLSIIADDTNYRITDIDNVIYMNKKVCIEMGYDNTTSLYTDYPIIWFPLGVFVMSNANIQKNSGGISISLTLKDQMSLLNGENGGTFESAITHSPMYVEEIGEDGKIIGEQYVSFYRLIYELVTEWGGIPKDFVIIDDVPLKIENIVRWVGSEKIKITPIGNIGFEFASPEQGETANVYNTGDSIGYIQTDYTYPAESDLTSNAGDSVTSVLDKIKNALGNYEYFFDVYGVFHFQKVKDYSDEGRGEFTLETAITISALEYLTNPQKNVYDFNTDHIVTSYSNAPAWQNIKNDYVVWGKQGDSENALRYHLIIDNVPSTTPDFSPYVNYQNGFNTLCWLYQDAFKIWRGAKSEQEARDKLAYAKTLSKTHGSTFEPSDDILYCLLYDSQSFPMTFQDWRLAAYFECIFDDTKYFYAKEILEEIPKIYDLRTLNLLRDPLSTSYSTVECSFQTGITTTTLCYWIDIIYADVLKKFTVTNIGKRTKTINNDKINCLLVGDQKTNIVMTFVKEKKSYYM